MAEAVPVSNFAALPDEQFELLRAELSKQTSMAKALAWFSEQNPKLVPADLVPQDEFSYDLLVPYPGNLYLSYDTS